MTLAVHLIPLLGIPEVQPGDDLVALMLEALERMGERLHEGDVLVVTQKVVSKAEGRLVDLTRVEPSIFARHVAQQTEKDPRHVEVILREGRRIVKMDRGILIMETPHGFVCANAGVDASNVGPGAVVSLLPQDPDASARRIQERIKECRGLEVAVIISDSFGRPWREGEINVAIGVAGLRPIKDYVGSCDPFGHRLRASTMAVADELASAAELVMGKLSRIPMALVRGYAFEAGPGTAQELVRPPERDLFR